jgi:hypothetical protein
MKDKVNRAEAHQSQGGLIPLYHFNLVMATAYFRFDTLQLYTLRLEHATQPTIINFSCKNAP